ncbi:MAG TPA: type II secretion system major pseudopilin GspG [Kiritimatiellia bacterium]|nr:type II secretion system major pseudopilin GspG [Kiritimatiellia bacterium]
MKRQANEIERRDAGFTLIEILLVVVIIGILAAVAVPRLGGRVGQSQVSAAKASIGAIGTAIDLYETDNGRLPESLNNLMTKGSEPNWNGPYLRKAESLKDPWGNDFQYTKQGNVYTVASAGPDGSFGSADDVK